jgi:DNA-binding XRE family transcriptional regulator
MPSPQLPHHLRANRIRLSLSQDEVAFLLGAQSGIQVSRHEHFACIPTLQVALAYEAMFKRSVSELFGGLYQEAEKEVAKRAKQLLQQVSGTDPAILQKRETLADLAGIAK